jgi:hypothetical protein
LRFNAAKANAGGKTQNTDATERNVFKRSPVGSIIGKGLDLDACTVFIKMLHPTDEKKHQMISSLNIVRDFYKQPRVKNNIEANAALKKDQI